MNHFLSCVLTHCMCVIFVCTFASRANTGANVSDTQFYRYFVILVFDVISLPLQHVRIHNT